MNTRAHAGSLKALHPVAYSRWLAMKQRCTNPNTTDFHLYGGRGITFTPAWASFENFLKDMGAPLSKNYSLDRIESNLDYTKDNCRWVALADQCRHTSRACFIEFDNKRLTCRQWAQVLNVSKTTVARWHRLGIFKERAKQLIKTITD